MGWVRCFFGNALLLMLVGCAQTGGSGVQTPVPSGVPVGAAGHLPPYILSDPSPPNGCLVWNSEARDFGAIERCTEAVNVRGLSTGDVVPTAALNSPFKGVTVHFATDRQKTGPATFGPVRSDTISYGQVLVSIPRDHRMGALEGRSWWNLRFTATPAEEVMVLRTTVESGADFFAALRQSVRGSTHQSLLVFVHGYQVSFDDAARRTAQMAYDLGFEGASVFFSWPSQDQLLDYTVDEQNIADAQPHLEEFLREILLHSAADNIYLIAHSMGNRGLTRALATLAVSKPEGVKRIREIILAAPDIGTVEFAEQIVPALRRLGAPITLYASSNDHALALSERLHGGARAGEAGTHMVVLDGIETIDASSTDTDLVGHSYYGDRRTVLADMFYLVNGDLRARQRCCLAAYPNKTRPKYWVFLK